MDMVEACKALSSCQEEDVAAAALWLRCVPLEGEILDFFRPCVAAVHRLLAGMACVLTEEGGWVQPCHAQLTTNARTRELIAASGLLHEAGVSIVHPGLHQFSPALKASKPALP
jgi:hypothetical protein